MGIKTEIIKVVGPIALQQAKKFWSKDHGSKVKEGAFKDCSIEMMGDEACIVVNENSGEIVSLTSEYVQSYTYVKKKERIAPNGIHTYYYYKIIFNDGRKSYVRMRKKYRNAMENYC